MSYPLRSLCIVKRMRFIYLIGLFSILIACTKQKAPEESTAKENKTQTPPGMVWIPGGEFTMGTDDPESYEYERPAHRVKVDGFWMDETEITNEQFKKFVDATKYLTIAERKPDWEEIKKQVSAGTPKPSEEMLVAGALVFTPPSYAISTDDYSKWWSWQPGANWQHPEGPNSNLDNRWTHPVVQIAYDDGVAYCAWAGKRLPTEAEWEFASRGGSDGKRYSWGNDYKPQGKYMANTFQGVFPNKNESEDGFSGSSPVKTFPPNAYGLYDIIGNVWEWTNDYFNVEYYEQLARARLTVNPKGASKSNDPREPLVEKRVTRGGSFLCATDYCVNFRPSARQGTAFDSGQSHIGFRCVVSAQAPGRK